MRKGAVSRRMPLAEAKPMLTAFLQQLEAQLSDGRRFLFGDAPTAADFSVYHPLWFIRVRPPVMPLLTPFERVCRWLDQVAAIGHGNSVEIASTEAVNVANRSTAAAINGVCDAEGFALGDAVEVLPVDYGLDPVAGALVNCTLNEVSVRRTDVRAGEVVVHFPRLNYELRKPLPAAQ
jgi:hypothetical protein